VCNQQAVLIELKNMLKDKQNDPESQIASVDPVYFIVVEQAWIKIWAHTEQLKQLGIELRNEFSDAF
jgi:hypothetical protein